VPDVTRTCNQLTTAGSGLDPSKQIRRASGLLEQSVEPDWLLLPPCSGYTDGNVSGQEAPA
jgi:hypothetical protein